MFRWEPAQSCLCYGPGTAITFPTTSRAADRHHISCPAIFHSELLKGSRRTPRRELGWLLPRHLQVTMGLCLVALQLLGPGTACHRVSPRRTLVPTNPSCAACSWQRDRPHSNIEHLSPILLWQVGLHFEENVLSLFDQALDLLDGLSLFGTHVSLASGEEAQALASGSALSQHEHVLALDTVLCLGQGHPKDNNSKLEVSSICGAG